MARIGGFTAVLDLNACRINDGDMSIKHQHRVLKPWPQTINFSASSESNSVLIFDGCKLHLKFDLILVLGGSGIMVLLRTTNIFHDNNVKDMVTFVIAETGFKNVKQSFMTDGIKR